MAKLDRIANVQINLRTQAITEQSFSDMIIVGDHVLSPGRTMIITGADELLDLGMSENDPLYLAASDAFSALPSINQIFIGRRQVNSVAIAVGTVVEGNVYTTRLQWYANNALQTATATYTADDNDLPADVATGLAAAINATAVNATAVATAGSVALTSDTAGQAFGVTTTGNLTMTSQASTESLTQALAAASAESGNWYGIVITSRAEADVFSAAAWAEANEKLFTTSSDDPGIIDAAITTDLASRLQQSQYFRATVEYSANADTEYPEATLMSNRFTYYPGQETWANVQLPGQTYDNLSEGQANAAHNKNATTLELFRNFAITQGGKVAAGEWIDVIRLRDALVDQIKVSVVSAMINIDGGKVPYIDDGIQVIGNALRGPLDLNVRRGGLAPEELDENGKVIPSYTISLPLASQVPFNDKANRILRDVKFTARLAGAIHAVEIKGSLSYSL